MEKREFLDLGWKLFAGFNVLLGAIGVVLLAGGYEDITPWSMTSYAMSFLGTIIVVLYAFGGKVFSPELRKALMSLFVIYAVAEASYLLWDVYQAHTQQTEANRPLGAWVVLVFASSLSYFTLIAAWRYSQGHTISRTGE
jgi:drug/metabolite transporter (DMT)-like permease